MNHLRFGFPAVATASGPEILVSEPEALAGRHSGVIRAILGSGRASRRTRNALESRLAAEPGPPRYFKQDSFDLLRAVCGQLAGQPAAAIVDIAGAIDSRLAEGRGRGWRHESMPPDGEAMRCGLKGIDEAARALVGRPFLELQAAARIEVLASVQKGKAPGDAWARVPQARFFEDLSSEIAETVFAHPTMQARIGYLGFADVLGWHAPGRGDGDLPEAASA